MPCYAFRGWLAISLSQGTGMSEGFRGTVTATSGSALLVEEDPSEEGSGDKGYSTVTDETVTTDSTLQ